MNQHSIDGASSTSPVPAPDTSPILIIPYMWIGDFVRCHTVVSVIKARWPDRPIDVLTTRLCAPLLDYTPGVRKSIVWDLPRRRIAFGEHRRLADVLRGELANKHAQGPMSPAVAQLAARTVRLMVTEVLDWRVVFLDQPLRPPA